MKPFVLCVDVDGVLADFTWGFTSLAAAWHPEITPWPTSEQKTWEFDSIPKGIQNETWTRVRQHPSFWWDLPCRLSSSERYSLCVLAADHRVYFVTNRLGVRPEEQTVRWLHHLGLRNPNVIVTTNKALACRTIEAQFAIDDKVENIAAMHPWVHTTLFRLPYNRDSNVTVDYCVDSLSEWIGFVNAAASQRS